MDLPAPRPGLVINYGYVWRREAERGQEEGRKYRPSAIILASKDGRVLVVPITHSPPKPGSTAIELPKQIKDMLGLDDARSWVITNEVNFFTWPGYDLAPINQTQPKRVSYGQLPPGFTRLLTERVRAHAKSGQLVRTNRDTE